MEKKIVKVYVPSSNIEGISVQMSKIEAAILASIFDEIIEGLEKGSLFGHELAKKATVIRDYFCEVTTSTVSIGDMFMNSMRDATDTYREKNGIESEGVDPYSDDAEPENQAH